MTDPRVTRGMMRGGGHARVSVPMSAGWSDAEVRVLIPEPSRGLGDGVKHAQGGRLIEVGAEAPPAMWLYINLAPVWA